MKELGEERKVNVSFLINDTKKIKAIPNKSCEGCIFRQPTFHYVTCLDNEVRHKIGPCGRECRKDKTSVIFVYTDEDIKTTPIKSKVKPGMLFKLRNGKLFYVIKGVMDKYSRSESLLCIGKEDQLSLNLEYYDNLESCIADDFDVAEIYSVADSLEAVTPMPLCFNFSTTGYNLVWKRAKMVEIEGITYNLDEVNLALSRANIKPVK